MNNKISINYINLFLKTKEKKEKSKAEIKITTTVIKQSLKYYLMSESNTCIAEPNLEVPPLTQCKKDYFLFILFYFTFIFLKILDNDGRSKGTVRSVIAFAIKWQQNNAVDKSNKF